MNSLAPSSRQEVLESQIGTVTKSYGVAAQPVTPIKYIKTQGAKTSKYLESARQTFLTQEQQETFSKRYLLTQYNDYLIRFLRSPAGFPFRRTFRRRILTVVLGTPYGELNPIIDSINILSVLATKSLTEDLYGKVAQDVPLIIRAFVSTIASIEGFVSGLSVHWTDVEFSESDRRVEEVALIILSLRNGLKEIVEAFAEYAAELGLGQEEITTARKIANIDGAEK